MKLNYVSQNCSRIVLVIVLTLLTGAVFAQPNENLKPRVGSAVRFSLSPPLRSIPPSTKIRKADKGDDDKGAGGPVNDTKHDSDPLVQRWFTNELFNQESPSVIPPTLVSFDGLRQASGPTPPDTVGDVGTSQYVQMVNSRFQVFNKVTGASVFGPVNINTLWAGFGGPCETQNSGDPAGSISIRAGGRCRTPRYTSSRAVGRSSPPSNIASPRRISRRFWWR